MIQGLGAEGSEGGVLVLVQVPKRGDRLGLCTEFNVEQLMQLLRCVAVVACAAVAVAVLLLHGALITRGRGAGSREIVAVLENFV